MVFFPFFLFNRNDFLIFEKLVNFEKIVDPIFFRVYKHLNKLYTLHFVKVNDFPYNLILSVLIAVKSKMVKLSRKRGSSLFFEKNAFEG